MDNRELLDRMEQLGVDVKGSVERFVGNEDLYIKFLKKFPTDPNYEKTEQAWSEQNFKDLLEYSHAMKGLTGNLGLAVMYDALCDMVSDLRAEEHGRLAEQMETIRQNYRAVCDLLK